MFALTQIDFYKADHKSQYPKGTEVVYSNFTPRSSRLANVIRENYDEKIIFFGLQYFIKDYLIKEWNDSFFNQPKDKVVAKYKRRMDTALGEGAIDVSHIEALHDLGYLPIRIKALEEGSHVPIKVPVLTVVNTVPEFFWLTNYIETVMSCELWKPCTTATIAYQYRKLLDTYANITGANKEFCALQGHDFSFRGVSGRKDAAVGGMGHLLSFVGTDTVSAIDAVEEWYNADAEKEFIGCSVPACYDSETEILTEDGFIKFSELTADKKVAQYLEDGSVSFVVPSEYYNMPYEGYMVHWTNDGHSSVDILVTPNHRMVRIKEDKFTHELFEAGDTSYKNRKGYSQRSYLPVSGNTSSKEYANMTPFEKLKVAFQADGSFPSREDCYKSGQIRFSLKKERKKDRLISLLNECDLSYTVSEKDKRGYYSFWINPNKDQVFQKNFDWVSLNKSVAWYNEFITELGYWDGCFKNNCVVYSSTNKQCIDKIQAIAAISSHKTHIKEHLDKRGNRKLLYSVVISNKNKLSGANIQRKFVEYKGTVHCVSVPSKMLIVRRNNKVTVCGNTEHSVMCMGTDVGEFDTFKRLVTEVYPSGIVSIVSDTWDYWKVLTEYLPALKQDILNRPVNTIGLSKVVIRPDSGDPVKIICGDPDGKTEPQVKGSIELLWDVFGGTINEKGYKELDSHIGLIYGDSITLDRAHQILDKLEKKGFASSNIVFGIGSFTYQYNTRDSFGFAMKATYGEVNGVGRELFKDPVTDSGIKKSAKGLLRVEKENDNFVLYDQQTWEQEKQGELKVVFENGELVKETNLSDIRKRVLEG